MTIKQYFNTLNVLFLALLSGQFIFFAVTLYLSYSGQFTAVDEQFEHVLMYVAPVAVIVGLAASFAVTQSKLAALKQLRTLSEKLTAYRTAMITKYALLEFPCFFALVCYLLTSHYIFLMLAVLLILVFLINKPLPEKAASEMELSQAERALLNNPDTLV
jgi:hypothetical protein